MKASNIVHLEELEVVALLKFFADLIVTIASNKNKVLLLNELTINSLLIDS